MRAGQGAGEGRHGDRPAKRRWSGKDAGKGRFSVGRGVHAEPWEAGKRLAGDGSPHGVEKGAGGPACGGLGAACGPGAGRGLLLTAGGRGIKELGQSDGAGEGRSERLLLMHPFATWQGGRG
jgi:hypothetical protein